MRSRTFRGLSLTHAVQCVCVCVCVCVWPLWNVHQERGGHLPAHSILTELSLPVPLRNGKMHTCLCAKYMLYQQPEQRPTTDVKVLATKSCPMLYDLMDCSPPGFSVHGLLKARILDWVAFPCSRGASQPRDGTWVSCIAGRVFTIWATREAHGNGPWKSKLKLPVYMTTSQFCHNTTVVGC